MKLFFSCMIQLGKSGSVPMLCEDWQYVQQAKRIFEVVCHRRKPGCKILSSVGNWAIAAYSKNVSGKYLFRTILPGLMRQRLLGEEVLGFRCLIAVDIDARSLQKLAQNDVWSHQLGRSNGRRVNRCLPVAHKSKSPLWSRFHQITWSDDKDDRKCIFPLSTATAILVR